MSKNIFKSILKRKKKRGGEINPEDIFLDSTNLLGFDNEKEEATLSKPISIFMEYLPATLLLIAFIIFSYRLYILQVKNYDFYKAKANNNRYNSKLILANRGEIFDRNGQILAENIISSTTNILKREYIKDPGFSNILGYITYPKQDDAGNY